MELINSYRYRETAGARLDLQARSATCSIRFEGRRGPCPGAGTEAEPYKGEALARHPLRRRLGLRARSASARRPAWSRPSCCWRDAQDIERAFAASAAPVPFTARVRCECSAPDKPPLQTLRAVYFLMGDRFSEDPFVLFQMAGAAAEQLLADLLCSAAIAWCPQAASAKARRQTAAKAEAKAESQGALQSWRQGPRPTPGAR